MEYKKDAVRKLLKSRRWYTTDEINKAAKSEHGTRRARELRSEGFEIKTRFNPDKGKTEYRVTGRA